MSDYDPVAADYPLLLLLTGLRRNEGAKLTWDNVDLVARTFTIPDPKNHEPHTLSLSDYLYDLLTQRAAETDSDYVFPGPRGYLADPRDQLARVITTSKVPFIINDLRRTFITIAESLDIPGYTLKQLINHKMSGDVTAGYIVINVERLRGPMQRITDYVLGMAEITNRLRSLCWMPGEQCNNRCLQIRLSSNPRLLNKAALLVRTNTQSPSCPSVSYTLHLFYVRAAPVPDGGRP